MQASGGALDWNSCNRKVAGLSYVIWSFNTSGIFGGLGLHPQEGLQLGLESFNSKNQRVGVKVIIKRPVMMLISQLVISC